MPKQQSSLVALAAVLGLAAVAAAAGWGAGARPAAETTAGPRGPAAAGPVCAAAAAEVGRSGTAGGGSGGPAAAGPDPGVESPSVDARPQEADPDERTREGLVGVWKQDYTGVRWLRVRPDGTATMFVDPDWVAKAVIGGPLTIEIEWTVENGRALFRSVSGKPQAAFKTVSVLYGRDRDRPVVELTEEKFVLLDEEDGSRSEWTRVKGEAAPPAVRE